ncbi:hypothetical protein SAMN04487948_102438 [Halogranum amylolyticum]|uniref:Cox cluster protein n=1 Tax=Halogranum amylolyticum TaxID=660520 RepID=A0A1H8PRC3_9EURY|nr:hypothetical protein [Halogranum amylolyticum]SEO44267.1 hypothetical protein SAMN04487948_102438 [Halogranum amylolyticum]
MDSLPPFVDSETSSLDTSRIWQEAAPLAGLILLFGALALVPYLLVLLFAGNSLVGALFTLVAQFVLAVGGGVVLLYVVARGIQLADE